MAGIDWELVGIAAALLSAAAWAAGSILYKKLGEKASPLGMNLVKGVLSLGLLLLVLLATGYEPVGMSAFLILGASGLLGITLGDTFFFEALQDLGAHTLILLSMLGQLLTVVFAVLLLEEALTLSAWVGIVLVIIGIAVVLFARLGGERGASGRRGLCYGLLAVLCMSVSVIVVKQGLATVSPLEATFVRMLWGVAGLLVWGGVTRQLGSWVAPFRDLRLIRDIVLAVCVATFGGFYLSHVALKHVDVAIANTLNSTEPLFVLPLAAIFLKDKITPNAVLGTVLALAGVGFIFNGLGAA